MEEKDWDDEECDDTPTMTTVSRHCFGDDSETPSFSISIIENMKEDYGLFVWPCSVVLAEYVWQQKHRFSGATVVEVLDNMRRVCELNKLECNVLGLTWGVWDAPLFSLQPTLILGADVLYDSNAFDDLFATVTFFLRNSPGSIFITSYHNRSGHHLIEFLMGKWGLKCLKLLDGFSFLPSDKASLLSGNIQLAEIAPISKDNA
ncbi:probable methyltransferase-like protein 23 isoform X3 [Vigna umbellata]|uniref:probable methyltransferase-like protein 23 isoform X3 n=1 Tax=Vigna umbellata TaxID=87088 RepID=UPI001F5FDDEE|nr:probable methyltransferase-like protein 23 isoform X3 [Vigna umbellata]